ncbi:hypothetical protein [Sphingomonas sp. CARO-RG-8B-R24-01]|uniref:hypothetical protein n=1 Tax=Sphingomonas sp. CARO-RG-8B-R24-01 TaxID=2914831 RepID=UPI001F55D666|nr:hypothetical protein [Sphingomonas sp. CARO-RG-8B-R24-01]
MNNLRSAYLSTIARVDAFNWNVTLLPIPKPRALGLPSISSQSYVRAPAVLETFLHVAPSTIAATSQAQPPTVGVGTMLVAPAAIAATSGVGLFALSAGPITILLGTIPAPAPIPAPVLAAGSVEVRLPAIAATSSVAAMAIATSAQPLPDPAATYANSTAVYANASTISPTLLDLQQRILILDPNTTAYLVDFGTGPNTPTGDTVLAALTKLQNWIAAIEAAANAKPRAFFTDPFFADGMFARA